MDATLYYRCTTQTVCLRRRLHARRVEHHTALAGDGAGRQILAEAAAHKAVVAVRPADLAPDRAEFAPLDLLLGLVDVHHPARGSGGQGRGEGLVSTQHKAHNRTWVWVGNRRDDVSPSMSCRELRRLPAALPQRGRNDLRLLCESQSRTNGVHIDHSPLRPGHCSHDRRCCVRTGRAAKALTPPRHPVSRTEHFARTYVGQPATSSNTSAKSASCAPSHAHTASRARPLTPVVEQQQRRGSIPSSIRRRQLSEKRAVRGCHRGEQREVRRRTSCQGRTPCRPSG
mmetsp:Transcript_4820/g.12715  ORF Transcript_4820/g.12715 Transcript_4820/m.12715 type:complete len:285 (-) Transcript_4820:166-1020(-)